MRERGRGRERERERESETESERERERERDRYVDVCRTRRKFDLVYTHTYVVTVGLWFEGSGS